MTPRPCIASALMAASVIGLAACAQSEPHVVLNTSDGPLTLLTNWTEGVPVLMTAPSTPISVGGTADITIDADEASGNTEVLYLDVEYSASNAEFHKVLENPPTRVVLSTKKVKFTLKISSAFSPPGGKTTVTVTAKGCGRSRGG